MSEGIPAKAKVLLVDDDNFTLTIVMEWILEIGYSVDTARCANDAMEKLEAENFEMLITDEEMPGMKGSELIGIVHERFPDVSCMVISGHANNESIVNAMRDFKAINYLFKPFAKEQLARAINSAFEFRNLRMKSQTVSADEREFFQTVMKTFDWKDALRQSRNESIASDMINQVNIGLFQGKGIGSLISTLGMLFEKSKRAPDDTKYFLVRDVLFDMARESFEQSLIVIQSMTKAQSALTTSSARLLPLTGTSLYALLKNTAEELSGMLAIKDQRILISELPPVLCRETLHYDAEQMSMTFRELLINAMKYSHENDTIYALAQENDNHFELKFVNPAHELVDGEVGITGKYETLVFEPFFRLSKVVDERYVKEDISFGLGLPVVKRILQQHNGTVSIYTLNNHLKGAPEKDVCVTLRLPLQIGVATTPNAVAAGGRF